MVVASTPACLSVDQLDNQQARPSIILLIEESKTGIKKISQSWSVVMVSHCQLVSHSLKAAIPEYMEEWPASHSISHPVSWLIGPLVSSLESYYKCIS